MAAAAVKLPVEAFEVEDPTSKYKLFDGSAQPNTDSENQEAAGIGRMDGDASPRTSSLNENQSKLMVQSAYMAVFAVLGALLRVVLAQLFGEECANPGSVGWLASSSPLCVTADGSANYEGGIVFADLPANMIGSFIMGLMQTTAAMGLSVSVPIAWAQADSWFQQFPVIHLAIRTGFCGSLTTFSSWNSSMVVLIFGAGSDHKSLILRALFGYIIGMETALGSFVYGKKVGEWIFLYLNEDIADETRAVRRISSQGVHVNPELPDLERRFLPNLDMDSYHVDVTPERLEVLDKWRLSTASARRFAHPDLAMLNQLEKAVLVDRLSLDYETDAYAKAAGWKTEYLTEWVQGCPPPAAKALPNASILFTPPVACVIIIGLYGALVAGLVLLQGASNYVVTYRTMVYALIFAPPGALLRWHLSGYNGKLAGGWSWLPVGTLTANIIGSMVSITCIALEFVSPSNGFWEIGSMRAVKVGFSGCLTTVSTFVSEVHGLSKKPESHDKAYIYIFTSLGVSCMLASILFATLTASINNR